MQGRTQRAGSSAHRATHRLDYLGVYVLDGDHEPESGHQMAIHSRIRKVTRKREQSQIRIPDYSFQSDRYRIDEEEKKR
jgi:hypothetical protein